jgi:pentatricopeptide repeat protein
MTCLIKWLESIFLEFTHIKIYAQLGLYDDAIALYYFQMVEEGVECW